VPNNVHNSRKVKRIQDIQVALVGWVVYNLSSKRYLVPIWTVSKLLLSCIRDNSSIKSP